MFLKTGTIKNFAILTGKQLCWGSLFNRVTGLKACNFLKNRLQHQVFPVDIAKFLKIAFLYKTSDGCF